ncbi:MAG: PilZ domain-containing protein [Terricaulis sp.]
MSSAARKLDLASVADKLTSNRVRTRERRRFYRAPLVIDGRMLDSAGTEYDCRTADISPGDVRIASAVRQPPVGERVVVYLEGLGRVTGRVARTCGEGEVAIIFDFSAHKREKLTEQLMVAINKDLGVAMPAHTISKAPANAAQVELENGESYGCEILDFSLSGITVRTLKPPPLLGSWVRVGGVYGRVARLIEGGFAVDFEPRQRS